MAALRDLTFHGPALGSGSHGAPFGPILARPGTVGVRPGWWLIPLPTLFICRADALRGSSAAGGRMAGGHQTDPFAYVRPSSTFPALYVSAYTAAFGCWHP